MNESSLNASVGLKLRSLRLQRHVKQADAARDLGVSPAYLNLIEKGKRVMPFPLLWKALRYFDQDPEQFMGSLGQGPVDETLAKLLDEPLLKSLEIDPADLQHLSAEPKLAGTVAALFNLYKNTRTQLEKVTAQQGSGAGPTAAAVNGAEERQAPRERHQQHRPEHQGHCRPLRGQRNAHAHGSDPLLHRSFRPGGPGL